MPPTLWALVIGTFLNRFGTFVIPFLVLYLTRNGFTAPEAGVALAAYGLGSFFASIAGGHLADRIGRRYTIALSMFSSAATMMALSQSRTFAPVVVFAALAGLTSELYRPAASALIADIIPPDLRVTAYALYRLAINAGVAAGPAIAGYLADRSFFYLFLGDAVTSVLYGIFALIVLPHGIRTAVEDASWLSALQVAARDRAFLLFIAATMCVTLVDFQMSAAFALHVRDQGFSAAVFGALISLNGAIIILVEIFLTKGVQRFRRTHAIAAGYLLCGLGFAANAVATTLPSLVLVIVIFTIGEMISSAVSAAFVADASPERFRGRYMGLFGFAWAFGLTLGPAAGTWMYGQSPSAVWIGCGVLGVLSAVLVLLAGKAAARQNTQASATVVTG